MIRSSHNVLFCMVLMAGFRPWPSMGWLQMPKSIPSSNCGERTALLLNGCGLRRPDQPLSRDMRVLSSLFSRTLYGMDVLYLTFQIAKKIIKSYFPSKETDNCQKILLLVICPKRMCCLASHRFHRLISRFTVQVTISGMNIPINYKGF